MKLEARLEKLPDDRVLGDLAELVSRQNRLTARMLLYLNEVERRKLHLREACSSLFAYCVERLHMSEAQTARRIQAARAAARFPVIQNRSDPVRCSCPADISGRWQGRPTKEGRDPFEEV